MNHQGQSLQQSSPSSSNEKGNNGFNSIWTPELVQEIKKLHAAKFSCGFIAGKFGLTRNQVIGKFFRLGLKGHQTHTHRVVRAPAPARGPRRPKLKIVVNGGGLRLIKTSETDLAPLRCAKVVPRHISLLDLQRGDCRYPYGDGPFTFCGCPADGASSYCLGHRALCSMVR
jgi:GcrA cell cycle regulator